MACSLEKATGDALRFLPGVVGSLVHTGGRSKSRPGSERDRSQWRWHDACATTAMRSEAGHQLAFHGSSGIVICDDIRFECLILFVPPRATTTVSAVNPCPLRATTKSERLVLACDQHVSRRNAKPRLVASAQHHLQFSRPSIQLTAQGEELTTGRSLEKGLVCGSSAAFCACDCNHCSGNYIRSSS